MENNEKVKQFAKVFFNKIINELNDDLVDESFAEFLKKKTSSVPNEKKETVYSGIVLNIIFAIEYIFKIDNSKNGLSNIEDIIKKLESKKSETDKMFSSVIQTEINFSKNSCLVIFSTECFHSFVNLLEIETKTNLKETINEILSEILLSFLKKNDCSIVIEIGQEKQKFQSDSPEINYLLKKITLN